MSLNYYPGVVPRVLSPGCCPPGEAGHWSLSIYIKERCLSVCLSVCPYVRASLEDGGSDLGRIWLAHAEFINLESETVIIFLTSPTTTPFPADRARFRSRANISGTPNRISAEFTLPVLDVGRHAPSVSFIAGDAGKRRYFANIRVLKKYAHIRLPVYDRRRAAVFDAPVPRNASNVFEGTTFNGTVEMTRVGIRYIRGTDYPGKYCT